VFPQGAFRKVAADSERCAAELTDLLKKRMVEQRDQAADCIQLVRKLGEPIESLQVWSLSDGPPLLKPRGYTPSYSACRIGHLVPFGGRT
jgi:hypothetical protein